jgi:hypothetical protein
MGLVDRILLYGVVSLVILTALPAQGASWRSAFTRQSASAHSFPWVRSALSSRHSRARSRGKVNGKPVRHGERQLVI